MKRLQIYLDEELDEALTLESHRQGTSKAALLREYAAEHLRTPQPRDPIDGLIGLVPGEPDDSSSIDAVVYG